MTDNKGTIYSVGLLLDHVKLIQHEVQNFPDSYKKNNHILRYFISQQLYFSGILCYF